MTTRACGGECRSLHRCRNKVCTYMRSAVGIPSGLQVTHGCLSHRDGAHTQVLCNESHRENTWLSKIRAGPDQIPKRQQRRRKRVGLDSWGDASSLGCQLHQEQGGSFCFFFSIVVSFSSGHITMTALPCRRSRARYRRPCAGRHPALGTSLPERLTAGACHRDLTKQIPSVRTQPAAPGSAVFPPTR